MINNPAVGQHVWFLDTWSQMPVGATIIEVGEERCVLKWDEIGTSINFSQNLFSSKAELLKDMQREEEKRISEIKKSIKNVNDLVRFMYDNVVATAEEYTDWTARKAVREIAKEMLNIELEM